MTAIDRPDQIRPKQPSGKLMSLVAGLGSLLAPVARHSGRQLGRAARPAVDHVRRNPVPYAVGALALGATIGLLMSRSARRTVGDTVSRAWAAAGDPHLLDLIRRR